MPAQARGLAGEVKHRLGELGLADAALSHENEVTYPVRLWCSHSWSPISCVPARERAYSVEVRLQLGKPVASQRSHDNSTLRGMRRESS